ncbi:hypothetical protein WJX84_001978 [Apatococcus fuscideae]|uniref:Uncharacterized protein n=1 Tax=Apatococcus fuscideae TaxID=2026836 RepID=A0AAW1TI60_9CHLO
MRVTDALLIAIPIALFIAGLVLGLWLGAKWLSGSAGHKYNQTQQLDKVVVLAHSPGSSSASPRTSHDNKIRTRIDTYDGIQRSLGHVAPVPVRRTGSVELGDICRTASALSMFLEEAEQRPLINRLLSMPSAPRDPSLMDTQMLPARVPS